MSENSKLNKRDFLKKAGLTTVGALGASALATPYVRAQSPIKWRLQTYAGPALAEHVIKPSIDAFNKAANGDMVIELYTADQLVPQGELFRAVQSGTIDAAQSDDDSMASPVDVAVFGAYFPSHRATASMCPPCSTGTGSMKYGTKPIKKFRVLPGLVPVPGTPAIS